MYGPNGARLQRDRLRLLSGVAREAFTSGINTQLLCSPCTKLVLGQHAQYRFTYDLFWTTLQHRPDRCGLQTARPSTVTVIDLLVDLVPRQFHLFGIHYDDMVTAIEMRSVRRLVLADQHARDLRRKASQYHATRVDHEPIATDHQFFRLTSPRYICSHQLVTPFRVETNKESKEGFRLCQLTFIYRAMWPEACSFHSRPLAGVIIPRCRR